VVSVLEQAVALVAELAQELAWVPVPEAEHSKYPTVEYFASPTQHIH
jgi:hypothetical protein